MPDKNRRRLFNLLLSFFKGELKEDFFYDSPYRKFYRKIYFETFKHLGFIQWVLTNYLKKETPIESIAALILGASQILFLDDIPDYAAVNESVALVKGGQKSLVNAILRKISSEKDTLLKKYSIYLDFPEYFIDRWKKNFDTKKDFENFLYSIQKKPDYYLLDIKTLKTTKYFEDFDKKRYYPMDINSQKIPQLFDANNPQKILDCCAAPGGKTIILSKKYPNAKITAIDISKERIQLLEKNINNFNLNNVNTCLTDFLEYETVEKYDLILLDAPCTALGTIRKHPEVVWLKNDKDINKMSKIQKRFLEKGLSLLKNGGILIYSVCSLEKEEGQENINYILKKHENIKLLKPIYYQESIIDNFFYTPFHLSDGDGFFAAVLKKD